MWPWSTHRTGPVHLVWSKAVVVNPASYSSFKCNLFFRAHRIWLQNVVHCTSSKNGLGWPLQQSIGYFAKFSKMHIRERHFYLDCIKNLCCIYPIFAGRYTKYWSGRSEYQASDKEHVPSIYPSSILVPYQDNRWKTPLTNLFYFLHEKYQFPLICIILMKGGLNHLFKAVGNISLYSFHSYKPVTWLTPWYSFLSVLQTPCWEWFSTRLQSLIAVLWSKLLMSYMSCINKRTTLQFFKLCVRN